MSRSSVTPAKIMPRPSNKKLKKLEKLKRKSPSNSAPSSSGSTMSSQSESLSHETNHIDGIDSIIENINKEATPIEQDIEIDTPVLNNDEIHEPHESTNDKEGSLMNENKIQTPVETNGGVITPVAEVEQPVAAIEQPQENDTPIVELQEPVTINEENDATPVELSNSDEDVPIVVEETNNEPSVAVDKEIVIEATAENPQSDENEIKTEETAKEPLSNNDIEFEDKELVHKPEVNIDDEINTEEQVLNNVNKSEMDVVVEQEPTIESSIEAPIENSLSEDTNDVPMEEIVQETPFVNSDDKSNENPIQFESKIPLSNEQVDYPNETEKCVDEEDISMDVDTESEAFTENQQKLPLQEEVAAEIIQSEGTPEMEVESVQEVESDFNDIEIVESVDEQIFTIKQDVLDFINVEEASAVSVSDESTKDNVNILLNHRKYVLKSITTEEATPFASGILASQLNADYDISVNILKNGHIKFSNISNRHVLNLEYNLLEILQISLGQLPYLKVFLKSNYSSNSLNDRVQGEMNPSVLILDTSTGSLWDFESIKGSFGKQSFFHRQNNILKKLQFTAEKDITFLPKSGCILFKNDKNQLILFNVYKNQVTSLKHKHEKRSKGLFKKVFSYIETPRTDVVDFVVEESFNDDTITVLFTSDIAMYHIRKHNGLPDSKYHFDQNVEFDAVEKDDLIYNSVLDKQFPVTLLALNKVYSDKKNFFYSMLVAKDISKLVHVNISISDKFEVLGYYELDYFEQASVHYRGKLNVQVSYIDQQDFYTSFITYKNEILFSEIPLNKNNNQLLFSDVVVYTEETSVLPGTVYQIEYENEKSTCLSYQTGCGGQFTYYQLHIKNQPKESSIIDHRLEFLNFHIGNYIFDKVIDNDCELFCNKLDYQWLSADTGVFEKAFKNQIDLIISSSETSQQQKISLLDNGLNNIKVNIGSWLTFASDEFMKELILTILGNLSSLKVVSLVKVSTSSAEQSVLDVFKNYNQTFIAGEKVDSTFGSLLDFVSDVIYDPLLCEVDRQYRCQYFNENIGMSLYDSVLFSTKVNNNLTNFVAMTRSLNLEYSEKVISGLVTVLNLLYYQNQLGINRKETLVLSIGSIFDAFKDKLQLDEINAIKYITILNKDWVSMFKIYDYLASTKQITYSEYPSFFDLEEDKKILISKFLDLYLNREYTAKLQNFFDIMGGLGNTFFIKEVYEELSSREKKDIVTEVLWAFETLINKDYKKAFKVLSEVENNKMQPVVDGKKNYKDFKEFKDSMMRLCEVLSSDEEK